MPKVYKVSKQYIFLPANLYLLLNKIIFPENKLVMLTLFDKYPTFTIFSLTTSYSFCVKGVNQVTFYLHNQTLLVLYPSYLKKYFRYNKFFGLFFHRLQFGIRAAAFGFLGLFKIFNFRYHQKWLRAYDALRYKFGFKHKLWFHTPEDFGLAIYKDNPHKKRYLFFSHHYRTLKKLVYMIREARPATIYKGKGISLFEEPLKFKEGKKTRW